MTIGGRHALAATCGLYCGACLILRAVKNGDTRLLDEIAQAQSQSNISASELRCEGCQSDAVTTWCHRCYFRACALARDITHCSQCPDFPCQEITDFNNDGMRHHAEALANIQRQRDIGLDAWLEEQEKRWVCPQCGAAVEWWGKTCFHCGAELPRRLPTSPRDRQQT